MCINLFVYIFYIHDIFTIYHNIIITYDIIIA